MRHLVRTPDRRPAGRPGRVRPLRPRTRHDAARRVRLEQRPPRLGRRPPRLLPHLRVTATGRLDPRLRQPLPFRRGLGPRAAHGPLPSPEHPFRRSALVRRELRRRLDGLVRSRTRGSRPLLRHLRKTTRSAHRTRPKRATSSRTSILSPTTPSTASTSGTVPLSSRECHATTFAARASVDPSALGPKTDVQGHAVLALTPCGRTHGHPEAPSTSSPPPSGPTIRS